jgi:L-lactate oxidase
MNVNRRDLLLTSTGAAATLVVPGPALAQNDPVSEAPTPPHIPDTATGGVPNNEKKISIVTLRDLEAEAQKVMAPFGFAYVSGGAGDKLTMRENPAAFNRWVINPDFMSGVGAADTTTTILGTKTSYPVITAPMGNQSSVHSIMVAQVIKG